MKSELMKEIPSLEEAKSILEKAEKINPGPWIDHCKYVAEAARLIASSCADLDPDTAYVLGLLHDIGRETGKTTISHIVDGYNFSVGMGYNFLAKTCITHSCPTKNITDIIEIKENNNEDGYSLIETFLNTIEYDDYDRLIQLCDALALHNGFTLIEKRLVDVALRHGVHEHTVSKWKSFMNLKSYFDEKMGKSIYSVLPGVKENTFGL